MKSVNQKLVLKRLIGQINFSTRALFWSRHPDVFQPYLDDPQRWAKWTTGLDTFEVEVPREFRKLRLTPKLANATVENVEIAAARDEINEFSHFFASVLELLRPPVVDRVAIRAAFLVPTASFDALVAALARDLTRTDLVREAFPGSPYDMGLSWVFESEGRREDWQVLALKSEEMPRFFGSAEPLADVDAKFFPGVALFADIDSKVTAVDATAEAVATALTERYERARDGFSRLATLVAREL